MEAHVIGRDGLGALVEVLRRRGYTVVGPTRRDDAIAYDEVTSDLDLPAGWVDEQGPATYRLRSSGGALFGHTVGPHAWKRYLMPPVERLFSARRADGGFAVEAERPPVARYALLGVRACDLAAIALQDRVFLEGPFVDPGYRARREALVLIAVNCARGGQTCFCVSMGTGPRALAGFDLALTEILDGDRHEFVVEIGSARGGLLLEDLPHRPAEPDDAAAVERVAATAAAAMGRSLETDGLRDRLFASLDHPRWDHVAGRCLSCANCTLVCPTCFCSTIDDTTDLTGRRAERQRRWDSCHTREFSYIHGGPLRSSARARYRQWLTHKLAGWHDQFGSSGCVGCGRCITWCPVGIDITEEAAAIRAASPGGPARDTTGRGA